MGLGGHDELSSHLGNSVDGGNTHRNHRDGGPRALARPARQACGGGGSLIPGGPESSEETPAPAHYAPW